MKQIPLRSTISLQKSHLFHPQQRLPMGLVSRTAPGRSKQTASEQVFSATRTVLHHILGTLKTDAIDKTYRV